MTTASAKWRAALGEWAIPDAILEGAQQSPWVFPVESFRAPESPDASLSRDRAAEALGGGGSVLDVGCGGGAASLALTPPATSVVGVDSSPEMVAVFADSARRRGVAATAHVGAWPEVASLAGTADVVVCHHVVYNVADITPFVTALDEHARRRVVVELSARHPLSTLNNAWTHFWGIARPTAPTVDDFLDVLSEAGLSAHAERWLRPARAAPLEERAAHARIRLCLPASRHDEVRDYLAQHPAAPLEVATVWWDRADQSP